MLEKGPLRLRLRRQREKGRRPPGLGVHCSVFSLFAIYNLEIFAKCAARSTATTVMLSDESRWKASSLRALGHTHMTSILRWEGGRGKKTGNPFLRTFSNINFGQWGKIQKLCGRHICIVPCTRAAAASAPSPPPPSPPPSTGGRFNRNFLD